MCELASEPVIFSLFPSIWGAETSGRLLGAKAVGEEFEVAGQLAFGAARALGDGADFAHVRGIKYKYLVRLAKYDAFKDDSLGFVNLWR